MSIFGMAKAHPTKFEEWMNAKRHLSSYTTSEVQHTVESATHKKDFLELRRLMYANFIASENKALQTTHPTTASASIYVYSSSKHPSPHLRQMENRMKVYQLR